MSHDARVMVIDVDPERQIERIVQGRWSVLRAADSAEAIALADRYPIFAVISHLFENYETSRSCMARVRRASPCVRHFVLGHSLDLDEIIEAINDYQIDRILNLPIDAQEVLSQLESAYEQYEFNRMDFSDFRLGISERNKRVLCVDDDGDILAFYQDVLNPTVNNRLEEVFERRQRRRQNEVRASSPKAQSGLLPLNVSVASSGERAVKLVQEAVASGQPFAAGFFDMKMPGGIDGLETIRRIRAIDPCMMCAIMTAYTDHSLAEMQEVFDDDSEWIYFNKPCSETELQQSATNLVASWNHRRKMESVEKFSSKLKYLFYKQRYMCSGVDVASLIQTVCLKTIFEVLGADAGTLMLRDVETHKLVMVACQGLDEEGEELSLGLSSAIEQHGLSNILDASTSDNVIADLLAKHQIRSALSVPLNGEHGLIGIVTAALTLKSRKFLKEDLEIMLILADHMETAIRNARRVHELRGDASQLHPRSGTH